MASCSSPLRRPTIDPSRVTRLAVLSDEEGWLEGIRVDPAVRGRGVATNLQIAELAWAQAHDLRVLRYMTGQGNEGSLKLGAHHGFAVIGDRRFHGRPTDDTAGPGDRSSVLRALKASGALLSSGADESAIAGRLVDRGPGRDLPGGWTPV